MSAGRGARRAAAIVVGDAAWGLAFGALARTAGLTATEAVAMSALVSAGTAQLAVLGLWSRDPRLLPLGAIVLTTLVVNLRHLMLGVSLAPWLGRAAASRVYAAAFFLSDETWALSAADQPRGREGDADARRAGGGVPFLLGAGALLWVGWVGGTAAGYAAGAAVRDPARWALDFAAVAAILFLLVALWRGRGDALPWAAAAVVAVVASRLLPGQWYIALGALAGTAAGALRSRPNDAATEVHQAPDEVPARAP